MSALWIAWIIWSSLVAPAVEAGPDAPEPDLLGDVVVDATATESTNLPPRARVWIAAADDEGAAWVDAVAWDLELFGLYRAYVTDAADLASRDDGIRLRLGQVPGAERPAIRVTLQAAGHPDALVVVDTAPDDPLAFHRIADATLELLTGTPGALSAPLAFVQRDGKQRRAVLVTLADPAFEVVSAPDELVSTIAFTPDARLVYAASRKSGPFRIVPKGEIEAGAGSIYGVAFGRAGRFAVAKATDGDIKIVLGGGSKASAVTLRAPMALQPALSPGGRLAYVAAIGRHRRVVVEGDRVSSPGVDAQSPTFCPHPDGLRLAWIERRHGRDQLVIADATGRGATELGSAWRSVTAIACSPDGRLLAVLARDRSGRGLHVGNVDRWDPQRVAAADGDTIRWAPR